MGALVSGFVIFLLVVVADAQFAAIQEGIVIPAGLAPDQSHPTPFALERGPIC